MDATRSLLAQLPRSDRGRVLLPVPWDRADRLHAQLRRRGCPSTLCLTPGARRAALELWPGTDPAAAVAALAGLTG